MKPTLSVVVPVFDEEHNLDELIERCVAVCDALERPYEIVLVDDGSADGSRARRHPGKVRGVFLNRNYGQHNAVICGFAHSKGDVVVTLDADLQNPPEEIPTLLERTDAGYDVVGSVRKDRRDSPFRRLASSLVNRMVERATGVAMHDYGCMLRAYDRRVVDAVLACSERATFVPVLANCFARSTTEVEVRHEPRRSGRSKYGVLRLVHLLFDLTTAMTTAPLRMLTILGGLLSFGGVLLAALLLCLRLIYGPQWAVGGVFTLFAIAFLFLGAQLLAIGLLGEYIGRIHANVRGRPRYFVDRIVDGQDRRAPTETELDGSAALEFEDRGSAPLQPSQRATT